MIKNKKRIIYDFTHAWNFIIDNSNLNYLCPDQNKSDWRIVDLPHDWSIEGPFRPDNPTTSRGAYLPTGVGWYYKNFTLPENYKEKLVTVVFDGIYMNSDVWVNGHHLGHYPYGYTAISYDLSQYLYFNGEKNNITVRVDNSLQPSARWYTGAGILWGVSLKVTDLIRVKQWGVYITTPMVSSEKAKVKVSTKITNGYETGKKVEIINSVIDTHGRSVTEATSEICISASESGMVEQMITVDNPVLWDTGTPQLYTLYILLKADGITVDDYATTFGIRDIRFDANKGMFINGKAVKIKGVCLHNDIGCLGTAAFTRAYERRLELLKGMGCNAIRTSHNPFPPQFLDLCDQMGFFVMNEAFDEWMVPKKPIGSMDGKTQSRIDMHGYSKYFKEWHEIDLRSFVKRDRNHPSVIMWSIGNEIRDLTMGTADGIEIGKRLIEIVKEEDDSRPVTCGCNITENVNRSGFASCLDIVGYNYREFLYHGDHEKYPNRLIIGSETVSRNIPERRGDYHIDKLMKESWFNITAFKVDEDNFTIECYNRKNPSMLAEYSMRMHMVYDYVLGFFIWTGFDYLGEPAPYLWPVRSSGHGIFDSCGFAKDGYYFYKSCWTDEPILHIFPHWNHKDKEGKDIPVLAFTNCDYVELYLNGKYISRKDFRFNHGMHLKWVVEYQPGVLEAYGYKDGKNVCKDAVRTSDEPSSLKLQLDRACINADGKDIVYATVTIVDKDGIFVSDAFSLVQFAIEGEGEIIGVDNGDTSYVGYLTGTEIPAFNGLCIAVIRSIGKPGKIIIRAKSPGLKGDEKALEVVEYK